MVYNYGNPGEGTFLNEISRAMFQGDIKGLTPEIPGGNCLSGIVLFYDYFCIL